VRVRFGYQLGSADQHDPIAAARRAEELGFDVVLVSDHVGPGLSPLVTLAAIAQATERIRLGTFVLNIDMRNPVQLAWESSTLDRLSGGRFELGLGAGHTPQEYPATGIEQQPARERKRRLCEVVEVLRPLLAGEPVTLHGDAVTIDNAQIQAAAQPHLPLLVGGNGSMLLEHAGQHADVVGLQGLGRTAPDGHSHAVHWNRPWLVDQIAQVRRGEQRRSDGRSVELNALVQVATITDDAEPVYASLCERIDGITLDDARSTPYLLVGTVDEIAQKIDGLAAAQGITYFVVRALDDFAPVIAALR
jgi:probable F420-dependent oxidoreductase